MAETSSSLDDSLQEVFEEFKNHLLETEGREPEEKEYKELIFYLSKEMRRRQDESRYRAAIAYSLRGQQPGGPVGRG